MKPRFKIGQQVKIKSTGEKVKIVSYGGKIRGTDAWYTRNTNGCVIWYWEMSLAPFCPTRTGKYRNKKGQFRSVNYGDMAKKGSAKLYTGLSKAAQEQRDHFSYEQDKISFEDWQKGNLHNYLNKTATEIFLDSKQRNYQKILSALERIEKKIDELGRRV